MPTIEITEKQAADLAKGRPVTLHPASPPVKWIAVREDGAVLLYETVNGHCSDTGLLVRGTFAYDPTQLPGHMIPVSEFGSLRNSTRVSH